jgi:hypothetical protein
MENALKKLGLWLWKSNGTTTENPVVGYFGSTASLKMKVATFSGHASKTA